MIGNHICQKSNLATLGTMTDKLATLAPRLASNISTCSLYRSVLISGIGSLVVQTAGPEAQHLCLILSSSAIYSYTMSSYRGRSSYGEAVLCCGAMFCHCICMCLENRIRKTFCEIRKHQETLFTSTVKFSDNFAHLQEAFNVLSLSHFDTQTHIRVLSPVWE